jgi:hypothetical protein
VETTWVGSHSASQERRHTELPKRNIEFPRSHTQPLWRSVRRGSPPTGAHMSTPAQPWRTLTNHIGQGKNLTSTRHFRTGNLPFDATTDHCPNGKQAIPAPVIIRIHDVSNEYVLHTATWKENPRQRAQQMIYRRVFFPIYKTSHCAITICRRFERPQNGAVYDELVLAPGSGPPP